MKRKIIGLFIGFLVLIIFVSPDELLSAPYYEGKVISIIVSYSPGGGYDRMARLLAKYLPKYIPGKPSIIIQNMPGASGMIATNHLFSLVKPDGLTILAFNPRLVFAQLTKLEGIRFDLTKFSWIGSAAVESNILTIRSDLPYKTFDELLKAKEPIVLGDTGPGSASVQFPRLLTEFVGLKVKNVTYPSSADVMLALERKEVDGCVFEYSSLKPFIERGLVRPLIRDGISLPELEKLPRDEDLTTDNKAKTIMAMRSLPGKIGRPYVAPPGTPAEVMNILRDAFAKVAKDPELQLEAKKIKMDINYTSVEESLKIINYILNQPAEIVKEFSKYIKF